MNTETDIRKLEDVLCICFHGKTPTHTQIVEKAKYLWHTFLQEFNEEDLDKIIEYVEYNIPIASFEAESLVDENTQSEWLTQELYDEAPKYAYRRYAQYLRQQGFAEDTIAKIEVNCKKVLSYSANPLSTSDKKRGLVVGDVQAGKTANYTALINLACDFGYKIIVLLAGLTDSLREQTQTRIDEGFIGALSETIGGQTVYIGVGQEKSDYFAIPLTNSKNDFLKFIKENLNSTPEAYSKPLILVVKKNGNVLKQVQSWLRPGKNKISSTNILIVDDEADNASVNTKRTEDDPTIINKYIRKLFDNFSVATYVGYTATPFANIFINPDNDSELENLFPSDFIVQLKSPSNYFGAEKVFGTERYLRVLDEHEPHFLPPIHPKHTHFSDMPESLKEAICAFLLGCCVRTLRGQEKKHRSMLINISRFNALHEDIRCSVSQYVEYLSDMISQDSYKTVENFIKNAEAYRMLCIFNTTQFFEKARESFSFDEIKSVLNKEITQFKTVVINNSNTKSRFKYSDCKESGARVIVIGGFVLSRGLTLEGLMVSYYSRNASAYDSLLQMCRWFGYRPGYEDLCIIYMSQINIDNFEAVVDAVDDLKEQFAAMVLKGKKPREFGLMVKESPSSLATAILVTSRNKMQHTKSIEFYLSYGGEVVDTSKIAKNLADNKYNEDKNRELFSGLEQAGFSLQELNGRAMFTDVPKEMIASFIASLRVHEMNKKFNIQCLVDYIRQSQLFPQWDIVIANGDSKKTWAFCNRTVEVPLRTCEIREEEDFIRVAGQRNRLIDPGLLSSGLSNKDIEELTQLCGGEKPKSSTDYLKLQTRKPLLIIYPVVCKHGETTDPHIYMGYALAFPSKGKSEKAKYRANKIKYNELAVAHLDDVDEDEEMNND